jgi:phage tail sheath protein FI
MPVQTTYPGVYIEELPSSVRTIVGVTTSVTAFVGRTRRGPLNTAVTLTSFADFERQFGGISSDSPVSYAVSQFFANGGSVAIVVRAAAAGSGASSAAVLNSADNQATAPAVTATAKEPGSWGDALRIAVDYATASPTTTFNLRVVDTSGVVSESYSNLSMASADPQYIVAVVNSGSAVLSVTAQGTGRPDPSGTVSKPFPATLPDLTQTFQVAIGSVQHDVTIYQAASDGPAPTTVAGLATLFERKLRALPDAPGKRAYSGLRVYAVGQQIQVVAGSFDPGDVVRFSGTAANDLGLEGTVNPPAFPLTGGTDAAAPTPTDLIGSEAAKTGIQALRDVLDVNLLCLPELADYADVTQATTVVSAAESLCEDKRMFLLVDAPNSWTTLDTARSQLSSFDPVRNDHAALYFPAVEAVDPLTGRLRTFAPCGVIAGIMARTDSQRGVWKAPAGTEAQLMGATAVTVQLTDPENGLLNPLGINCLRNFPVVGPVVWGARTLAGADVLASQWKYVPVRRTALFLEESLYRGTQWVVFEPNDERLWSQIRLNVGAFLRTLFQQGAFQGTSARDAYFVKCDKDTTTQDDINRGVVNIVVGFAPLKPAEFVIVQIQQLAGQLQV